MVFLLLSAYTSICNGGEYNIIRNSDTNKIFKSLLHWLLLLWYDFSKESAPAVTNHIASELSQMKKHLSRELMAEMEKNLPKIRLGIQDRVTDAGFNALN